MGDNINMYRYGHSNIYSSGNNVMSSSSSDDISYFLRQILVPSSSPPLPSVVPQARVENPRRFSRSMQGISAVESSERVISDNVRGSGASSSVGASENDTDEYDCESEENLEGLVDEAPAKRAPPRCSSKRSRAAEVHNLSEKRRRSRINEKMKALQNLIPNSNKTDKASMLDEAIEYLKQLQLQVQMLSMRNGLSLHPLCLPGALQPIQLSQTRVGLVDENESLPITMSGTLPVNQETTGRVVFNLPNQRTASNLPSMPNITNSESSFGLETQLRAQFGPFQLHTSSENPCRDDVLPHHQLNMSNPLDFETGTAARVSLPFDSQGLHLKERNPLGLCMVGRDQSDDVLLKNIEHNLMLSPHLAGSMLASKSSSIDEIKIERRDF